MEIKRFVCGELEENCYIIYVHDGGAAYIIDPGLNGDRMVDFINEHDLAPKGILLTHHHYDHTGAIPEILDAFDIPVCIHQADQKRYGQDAVIFTENDIFELDGEKIDIVNTPGHTRGGVCFLADRGKTVFTGDTLFKDEVGRSDLADSDRMALAVSIATIIDKWDDDVHIWPGHGDDADMDYVKKNNPDYHVAMERYRCR